ncbi:4-carboxy-2-hydroxymuconate-6-semialdehyde dehydrogenase [Caulifigura coniformis]|uniref:4-carboxy-2-hydroxymuconate-6-semialdehyde dehydrogenase n=1 Tax=Caulifigura coniformis TaxID=2527983 RepID=A0A517SH01_9PLAN|nr:Gfo/Idh/MocA family oxidoreductase [Caulifigura coniformis]QDT55390.1 4-carboxy-2-hydroxymuconate-6-semialdehyde dehydrogenase [Caulifigura coniformis]
MSDSRKKSANADRLRVALVGCGQIADAHLQEIAKIPGAHVVATCDAYRDLAMQAAARFQVPAYYENLADMLAEVRPEVVHLATPAHTHFELTRQCLTAGANVYVEKPFTQDAREAETLVAIANERGLKVCVGHDQLFDPAWLALRQRVDAGEIGGVTHVESVLGYPISGQFGSQVAGDPRHWVRRLPGGLFQNTISHPLYRITEYLPDDEPEIVAAWARRSPFDFPTELNVVVRGASVTGTLTFSSTIPSQRVTRVYGSKGALEVDLDGQVVRRIGPSRAPGAFAKLLTPWAQWRDAGRNLRRNLWRFARADIHYFAGLNGLSERFYASIRDGGPAPISPAEIVRVTRLMDRIFEECRARDGQAPEAPRTLEASSPPPQRQLESVR